MPAESPALTLSIKTEGREQKAVFGGTRFAQQCRKQSRAVAISDLQNLTNDSQAVGCPQP
jgi:hypothetical protein